MTSTAAEAGALGAEPALSSLDRLLAIEDIKSLKSRYFQAVDTKDWSGIARLFTDDARVDFGGECEHHAGHHGVAEANLNASDWVVIGGPATAKVIENAVAEVISVHHGHDPRIEIQAMNRATALWSLYDRLEYDDEVMHGYGHYVEEYRRVEGQWRFAALTLTRLRVVWERKHAQG